MTVVPEAPMPSVACREKMRYFPGSEPIFILADGAGQAAREPNIDASPWWNPWSKSFAIFGEDNRLDWQQRILARDVDLAAELKAEAGLGPISAYRRARALRAQRRKL